jgi:hypothetical protein
MPYLKSECTPEMQQAVQAVEARSDECYRSMALLRQPRNVATWALLTAMAFELETFLQQFGADSTRHRIALINLDRFICGFHFIALHGKPASRLAQNYTYHGRLKVDAGFAHNVSRRYTNFLNIFPLWHKNHERMDLMPNGAVRFHIPHDSTRQRQVIAYQQLHHPAEEIRNKRKRTSQSPEVQRLFSDLFNEARRGSLQKKFRYEPSLSLIQALRPEYQERLDANFRHPEIFQLNGYSLAEFKAVYVALLILCAIHEHICYPWPTPGQPIPESSLVMVKTRSEWVKRLHSISAVPINVCGAVVEDLTLHPENKSFTSLCITPFVPLGTRDGSLAVAPQFPLGSAADDNALRQFSYTFPALFSAQNTQKEEAMRELLRLANPGYGMDFSILLPDGSAEIDVLIEDQASSTVVLAELKWLRKPYKPYERIEREKDVAKGVKQLERIREYVRANPEFLHRRGKLAQKLDTYRQVHHILLVRDYWHWVEPDDGIAILDFDEFLPRLRQSKSLAEMMTEMLRYAWLPIEDADFHVSYRATSVNGATIESALFLEGKHQ